MGRAEFYDMTVPGPANYLAEGIWHHNSGKTRAGAEWLVDRVLKHPVDALGQRTEWLAIAQTLTDARSVMIEGVSGLLNVLRRRGLVERRDFWYRKAPRLSVDFASGQRIYVDAADNADVGRGYNAAGAWCVAAGQLVLTDRGEVPIEGVGTSDRVWTRAGWRPVLGRVLTKRAAATVALGLSNGRELVCTPDHRVWVNGAWHQAREVVAGDTMATSAGRPSTPPACGPSAVPMTAGASSAGTTLPVTVLSVRTGPDSDVYDIGVEGEHEFFASGVLVHNCDEICKWRYARASWLEGIMPSLRASLLGDHPRVFVSTTPKPIKLLIDWYKDKSGSVHLTTGSTFDNRANLSEQSIREMVNAYDGSSVGQQELYGKLLENVEGALWKRRQLDADRVRETPELVRVVVAIDPNITGTGDETGLIAAGRGDDGDHYILEDWSGMQTGYAAARRAWELFHHVDADWLVVEENQGMEWLLTVMRDAYFELQREGLFLPGGYPPLRPVHARAGKRLRAQPVASRHEQHRSHMVGSFVDLEDQLTTHDFATAKAGDSPDRLDAMVYAELELVGNESKGHSSSEPAVGPLPGTSDPYGPNGSAALAGALPGAWGGVDPYSFSQ